MVHHSVLTDEYVVDVKAAVKLALQEALRAGVPLFYRDASGINMMEQPDGRKFEIRYIPGAPADRNYEILRELSLVAA